jgi:hypothetical protein
LPFLLEMPTYQMFGAFSLQKSLKIMV